MTIRSPAPAAEPQETRNVPRSKARILMRMLLFLELEANRVLREDFVELLRQADLRVRRPVVCRRPIIGVARVGDFELDGRLGVDVETNAERTAVIRRAEGLLVEIGVRLIQQGAFVANVRYSPASPIS